MTAQTILPANSVVDSGYDVANSCRFDDGSSAYMHKTPGGAGNRQKFTFSCWVKKTSGGTEELLSVGGSDYTRIGFEAGDEIKIFGVASGSTAWEIQTVAKFRDFSAWYNFVFAFDTTQGTASNRIKIYVNGVRVAPSSGFGDETYPDQNYSTNINNAEKHRVGVQVNDSGGAYDGYMSEVVLIDGLQLAPTSFGEFDEDSGIWKPIDVSDLTFGTNGFYLDFEDSANLGNDANGGTDLTEVNLAAIDQTTDTCTNNFATMNPLSSGMTLTEGNLNVANSGGKNAVSTFSVASGKWYVEMKATNAQTYNPIVGIATDNSTAVTNPASTDYPGNFAESHGYDRTGTITSSNATDQGSLTTSQSDNDIIGLAVDLDSGTKTAQWYVNGSSVGSAVTLVSDESYVFMTYSSGSQSGTGAWNFGNPTYANSSSATDGRGFGDFEYAPPSGFLSLCTKNLSEASS
jgi:hypothetical protein